MREMLFGGKGERKVVIDNIVCSTEIFVAACRTSTEKALAFTSSSASAHLDSPTQHANSPNGSPALQRSLTYVAASKMKNAMGLKSPGSGSKKSWSLGSGGSRSGPGKPKQVMTVGELMRIQMGISDAMDSRGRRALLRISPAQHQARWSALSGQPTLLLPPFHSQNPSEQFTLQDSSTWPPLS
ncbi:hypothetical protein ACE6H2_022846 [Prunus campanulata]